MTKETIVIGGAEAIETQATARGFRRSLFDRMSRFCLLSLFCLLIPVILFADIVHVYERSLAGGAVSQMRLRPSLATFFRIHCRCSAVSRKQFTNTTALYCSNGICGRSER